jgi:hypothetical protein
MREYADLCGSIINLLNFNKKFSFTSQFLFLSYVLLDESLFYFVREWILGCPLRVARCSPWFRCSDRCFPRRVVCSAFSPARVLFLHSSGADQISARRGEML